MTCRWMFWAVVDPASVSVYRREERGWRLAILTEGEINPDALAVTFPDRLDGALSIVVMDGGELEAGAEAVVIRPDGEIAAHRLHVGLSAGQTLILDFADFRGDGAFVATTPAVPR